MTTTHPIPREALPVVHRLRLEVERPSKLLPAAKLFIGRPQMEHDDGPPRKTCPACSFLWWYSSDPQSATDAIWPPDGRWCRACGSRPVDPAMGTAVTLHTCPECEREFCAKCIDAEGDYDGEGLEPIVYPCRECGEGEA